MTNPSILLLSLGIGWADSKSAGGLELTVGALAQGLVGKGYNVTVAVSKRYNNSYSNNNNNNNNNSGINIIKIPRFRIPFLGISSYCVLGKIKLEPYIIPAYKLIHAHSLPTPGALATILKKSVADSKKVVKTPVSVITLHGMELELMRKFQPWLERVYDYVFKHADQIVCVSKYLCSVITEKFDAPTIHIPNGIDCNVFRPIANCNKDIDILFVGRLRREKAVAHLLHVVQKLKSIRNVVIVGDGGGGDDDDGAEMNRLKRLVSYYKQSGVRVRFVGAVRNNILPIYYNRSKVLAITSSVPEGTPRVAIEALSCGIPVVAPKLGGIPEHVKHKVTGLLYPPNDLDAFKSALESILMADESYRQQLGIAGRKFVKHNFDVVKMIDNYSKLYEKLLLLPP